MQQMPGAYLLMVKYLQNFYFVIFCFASLLHRALTNLDVVDDVNDVVVITGSFSWDVSMYFILFVDSNARRAVQLAAEEFQRKTCIRLVQRTNQRDYVRVIPGDG